MSDNIRVWKEAINQYKEKSKEDQEPCSYTRSNRKNYKFKIVCILGYQWYFRRVVCLNTMIIMNMCGLKALDQLSVGTKYLDCSLYSQYFVSFSIIMRLTPVFLTYSKNMFFQVDPNPPTNKFITKKFHCGPNPQQIWEENITIQNIVHYELTQYLS